MGQRRDIRNLQQYIRGKRGKAWHTKREIAPIGIAKETVALRAGTGAVNLLGVPARKATIASIGELAKCATE